MNDFTRFLRTLSRLKANDQASGHSARILLVATVVVFLEIYQDETMSFAYVSSVHIVQNNSTI